MKVLFPLDGSPDAYASFDEALSLLGKATIQGTILVVQQKGFRNAPEDMVRQFSEDELDEVFPDEDSARVVFQEARRRAGKGVKLAFKTSVGNTAAEILQEAVGHDLLVMHAPRSGRRLLRRNGSLAIAQKAPCHILLLQGGTGGGAQK